MVNVATRSVKWPRSPARNLRVTQPGPVAEVSGVNLAGYCYLQGNTPVYGVYVAYGSSGCGAQVSCSVIDWLS